MFGLRIKLLAGLAGLLAILIAVTLLANSVLSRYSQSVEDLFAQDYDSAAYCQSMKEALERLTRSADALAWDLQPPTSSSTSSSGADIAAFDQKLELQTHIANLPGEAEATNKLANSWAQFREAYAAVMNPDTSYAHRHQIDLQQLRPLSNDVRNAAQQIIDMNLAHMEFGRGGAHDMTQHARQTMHVLALGGILLAGVIVLLATFVVLRPLRLLEQSARQIASGNLELAVPIRSRDEIGQLARAFNDMAAQLREFKRIDHEKLIRTQHTTQLAIDSLPDAVALIEPRGQIELVNETAMRLFNLTPGSSVVDLPSPWLSDLHQEALTSNEPRRPTALAAAVRVDDHGSARWFLPRTFPIRDEKHHVIGSAVMLADVTELRRLDEIKNHLLADRGSPEMKTPLTSIRMAMHLIAEQRVGDLNERQRGLFAAARDDSDRLHKIVETLLDMDRIRSGAAMMDLRSLSGQELIRLCVEPHKERLTDSGIALRIEVPQRPLRVRADEKRMKHVFGNLLDNAIRFTPSSGCITISLHVRNGTFAHFAVADTGSGIHGSIADARIPNDSSVRRASRARAERD